MTNELLDLLETIEGLRQQMEPGIPAALVEEIIRIQAEWLDNNAEAKRRIAAAVLRHLEEGGRVSDAAV